MDTWISVRIGELFGTTIVGEWGTSPTTRCSIPVLRSTNITNDGTLDLREVVLRSVSPDKLRMKRIIEGDILVEKSGGGPQQPAGRVAYCGLDFGGTCSNFVEIVRVKEHHNSKFVFYLLYHLYRNGLVLKYQQQTTGIINFKFKEYQAEVVRVPASKSEQTAIADILATVDLAIEQTEALIAKQRRIKAGLLHDLLTRGIDEHGQLRDPATHRFKQSPVGLVPEEWEVTNLGGIVDRQGGVIQTGPFGSQLHAEEYTNEGVPFVMPQDISQEGTLLLDTAAKIPQQRAHDLRRHLMKENDVLFARRGDLSRCAAIHVSDTAVAGSGCMLVRIPKSVMAAEWLVHVYKHERSQRQILARAVGSTMVNLNSTLLRDLVVMLPEKSEQDRILHVLGKAQGLRRATQQELNKLATVKVGLMQDLLSGQESVTELASRGQLTHHDKEAHNSGGVS